MKQTATSQESFVKLCGVDCAVYTQRAELSLSVEPGLISTSPTIIFLHGWLDNSASFQSLFPFFKYHNLIAVDFTGHGKSNHLPKGMNYHFFDLVYAIQDLVAWAQADKVVLVGHSMGGAAAALYAASCENISHLVLLEALGPLTMDPTESATQMRTALLERQKARQSALRIFESIEAATSLRAKLNQLSESQIKPIVERGIMKVKGGYSWSSDPRLKMSSINRLTEPQLVPLLSSIACPCLLIEAEQGLLAKRSLMQSRKKIFADLQECLLPGGHHIHLEQPKQVAQAILQFLNSR